MAASRQHGRRGSVPRVVSSGGNSPVSQSDGAVASPGASVVTAEDVAWLVGRLQAMVTATPAVWAGRGMTLLQLIALHFISALAPATPTDLAHALDIKLPAASAMIATLRARDTPPMYPTSGWMMSTARIASIRRNCESE